MKIYNRFIIVIILLKYRDFCKILRKFKSAIELIVK